MAKIWKWVAIISLILLILGAALVGAGYFTGSSLQRIIETTDFFDMTKFASREVLESYVSVILG